MVLGHALAHDRVRSHTADKRNARLDVETERRVQAYRSASEAELAARIDALDREWDIERLLELNAASFALLGTILGARRDRRWLWLPVVVTLFLIQHAVQGWCPPLMFFRRLGVRTRKEIDREKYALMALRGDFGALMPSLAAAGAGTHRNGKHNQ
jgi:hypothetical protein